MNLDMIADAKRRQAEGIEQPRPKPIKRRKVSLHILENAFKERENAIKKADITTTIKIYTDAVRTLYKDNAHILNWARTYEDQANTIAPLEVVQTRFKRAKQAAEQQKEKSLHELDYQLCELEGVINTLKRVHDAINN